MDKDMLGCLLCILIIINAYKTEYVRIYDEF